MGLTGFSSVARGSQCHLNKSWWREAGRQEGDSSVSAGLSGLLHELPSPPGLLTEICASS